MKKLTALLVSLVMLFGLATAAQASSNTLTVWIDGNRVQFGDKQPFKENGTTLVPVRMLLENLSFEIDWEPVSKVVTATSKRTVITLQVDHKTAYVNGKPQELLEAPQLKNGTTYVPLRFIVESTGYTIEWDAEINAVLIDTTIKSRGFMWQVEKDGNTVYLLGSIHVATEAMYPLRDEIQEAFNSADYLAVEVNIADEETDVGEYLDKHGVYNDGTTLRDHISAETYAALGELLTALEIEPDALDEFKPWLASMILSSAGAEDSDYDGSIGIDMHFLEQALMRELPILELESFESQYAMFSNFSPELQEAYLASSIYYFFVEEENLDYLSEMWVEGDLDTLTALADPAGQNEEFYNAMQKDRNVLMAAQIDQFLQGEGSTTYFVVVGALHMPGEDGIVALLEAMGYTVTRI